MKNAALSAGPSGEYMRSYTDLAAQIGLWIQGNQGVFNHKDLDIELGIKSQEEKNYRSTILSKIAKKKIILRHGDRHGFWEIPDKDLEVMDLDNTDNKNIDIDLPLGLNELVDLYPGDIMLIAGVPNSCKTTMSLWIAHEYARKENQLMPIPIRYFNSETTAPGLRRIIDRFPSKELFYGENKHVICYSRNSKFENVIFKDSINIIDYLEIYDNFYLIGDSIRGIHSNIGKGIAIVCMQKKTGSSYAKGGEVTLEKPRLVINLESNPPHGYICKITKAKNWKTDVNPNGLEIDFYLRNGWDFMPKSEWRHVSETDRVKINNAYLKEKNGIKGYAYTFMLTDGKKAGLNFEDLECWRKAYPYIDVDVILNDIQKKKSQNAWLTPKGWFFQISGYLNKLNKESEGKRK